MAAASSGEARRGRPLVRSAAQAVDQTVSRAAIVAEARAWIGTPYHHQASRKGAGCDCFGLVRGVWRALYGPEPEAVPAYSRDWGSVTGKEALIETARRHLVEIAPRVIAPGDVVVFRIRGGKVAKHAGIVSAVAGSAGGSAGGADGGGATGEGDRFVHAQEGAPVCEVTLSPWWRRRIIGAFSFPGLEH